MQLQYLLWILIDTHEDYEVGPNGIAIIGYNRAELLAELRKQHFDNHP